MRLVIAGPLVFALVCAGIWEGLTRLGVVDQSLLPPFSMVAVILWHLVEDPGFRSDLGITSIEIAVAFLVSVPIAIGTGFYLAERRRHADSFTPLLYTALAVPQSVFLPIFILAFGIGFFEKVLFGITHAYFVIVINTFAAARSVPAPFVLAARAFGATRRQIYFQIYMPAMLPLVLTGLRLGMIACIIGVLLTEMYASRWGVGRRIFGWGEAYQVPQLLAGVLLISVLTILVNESMRLFEVHAAQRYGLLGRDNK